MGKTKTNVACQKKSSDCEDNNEGIASPQTSEFHKKVVCLMCGQVNFLFYPWLMNCVLTFILCDSSWSILKFGLCTLFFFIALHWNRTGVPKLQKREATPIIGIFPLASSSRQTGFLPNSMDLQKDWLVNFTLGLNFSCNSPSLLTYTKKVCLYPFISHSRLI